jgi:hypothetical protein
LSTQYEGEEETSPTEEAVETPEETNAHSAAASKNGSHSEFEVTGEVQE